MQPAEALSRRILLGPTDQHWLVLEWNSQSPEDYRVVHSLPEQDLLTSESYQARQFPEGLTAVVLWLESGPLPSWLATMPVPILGLLPLVEANWHWQRGVLKICDAVLTLPSQVNWLNSTFADRVKPNILLKPTSQGLVETAVRSTDILVVLSSEPDSFTVWQPALKSLSQTHSIEFISPASPLAWQAQLVSRAKSLLITARRGAPAILALPAAWGIPTCYPADNQDLQAFFSNNPAGQPCDPGSFLKLRNGLSTIGEVPDPPLLGWPTQALEELLQQEALQAAQLSQRILNRGQLTLAEQTWSWLGAATIPPHILQQLENTPSLRAVLAPTRQEAFQHSQHAASFNRVSAIQHAIAIVPEDPARAVELLRSTWQQLQQQPALTLAEWETPLDSPPWRWERLAWDRAAHPPQTFEEESREKHRVLCWWVQALLAEATGELDHFQQACELVPDWPANQAAWGCALARASRFDEAIPPLRKAVELDPFDQAAARSLFQALKDAGHTQEAQEFALQRANLGQLLRGFLPPEEWLKTVQPPSPKPVTVSTNAPDLGFDCVLDGSTFGNTSFEIINRRLVEELQARGHRVHRVGESTATSRVVIRHAFPPNLQPDPNAKLVLMQPWEFGSLPQEWASALPQFHEIWAYSSAVRRCFEEAGVPKERLHLIPLGVDIDQFTPGLTPLLLRTTKRCRLLFVGGTIFRKGFDILLRAYRHAFRATDDVCLVVKEVGAASAYRGQTAQDWIRQHQSDPDAPELEYIVEDWPDEVLPRLYAACNALVHPYRGEGFGLPILEAMACGLPVIVPIGGASDDYCPPAARYGLPARKTEWSTNQVDQFPTVGRPWLLEPDEQALVLALRRVYEHSEEAQAKGRAARRASLGFTWASTAARIEERLRALSQITPKPLPVSSKVRVSLTMIVRNEEANLRDCLSGLTSLFDELIVVDTGSTDRTREIARECGATVFEFPWIDDFAAARNAALSHATGDYCFWLDADDRLDESQRKHLAELLQSLTGENVAYVMKCRCVSADPLAAATVVDHVRLFPRHPAVRWQYRVHEQILPALRQQNTEVRWANICIEHLGYAEPKWRQKKLERDRRLLQLELTDRPGHPFALFNLGSIAVEQGEYAEGLKLLQESLARSDPQDSIVRKVYALMVQCLRQLGQTPAGLNLLVEARQHYPQDAELLFLEGQLAREAGLFARSVQAFRTLISEREGPHFASVDDSLRGVKAHHQLALTYLEMGQLAEAKALWLRVHEQHPSFQLALFGLGDIAVEQTDLELLSVVLQALENQPEPRAELLARWYLKNGEFQQARDILGPLLSEEVQAVMPRVLFARSWLMEGQDLVQAEAALRQVLERVPEHPEARHNLQVLLQRRQEAELAPITVDTGSTS